jgi:predicted phosphodiesterase
MLTFLVLSDIHFSSRPEGSPHEADERLRRGLEQDCVAYAKKIGGVSAILVCGDVAWSGDATQYSKAANWLRNLCLKLHVDPQNVWVVPGNHDVDRSKTTAPNQRNMRSGLRLKDGPQLDSELERILGEAAAGEALLEALAQYNEFAAQFGCDISREEPFWTQELAVGGPYRLCLRGISSALISDEHDDTNDDRLVVGAMQVGIYPDVDQIHVTLCHHPYCWLHDRAEIRTILDGIACLQITGHTHRHDLRETAHGWHLEAGALQPDRREKPWQPRYNFVSCAVDDGDPPVLVLRVYPRVWTGLRFELDPDPRYVAGFDEKRIELGVVEGSQSSGGHGESPQQAASIDDPVRRLLQRVSLLSSGDRFRVAKGLELNLGELASLQPHQIPRSLVNQAQESGALDRLWDEVNKLAGPQRGATNPFTGNK